MCFFTEKLPNLIYLNPAYPFIGYNCSVLKPFRLATDRTHLHNRQPPLPPLLLRLINLPPLTPPLSTSPPPSPLYPLSLALPSPLHLPSCLTLLSSQKSSTSLSIHAFSPFLIHSSFHSFSLIHPNFKDKKYHLSLLLPTFPLHLILSFPFILPPSPFFHLLLFSSSHPLLLLLLFLP